MTSRRKVLAGIIGAVAGIPIVKALLAGEPEPKGYQVTRVASPDVIDRLDQIARMKHATSASFPISEAHKWCRPGDLILILPGERLPGEEKIARFADQQNIFWLRSMQQVPQYRTTYACIIGTARWEAQDPEFRRACEEKLRRDGSPYQPTPLLKSLMGS